MKGLVYSTIQPLNQDRDHLLGFTFEIKISINMNVNSKYIKEKKNIEFIQTCLILLSYVIYDFVLLFKVCYKMVSGRGL